MRTSQPTAPALSASACDLRCSGAPLTCANLHASPGSNSPTPATTTTNAEPDDPMLVDQCEKPLFFGDEGFDFKPAPKPPKRKRKKTLPAKDTRSAREKKAAAKYTVRYDLRRIVDHLERTKSRKVAVRTHVPVAPAFEGIAPSTTTALAPAGTCFGNAVSDPTSRGEKQSLAGALLSFAVGAVTALIKRQRTNADDEMDSRDVKRRRIETNAQLSSSSAKRPTAGRPARNTSSGVIATAMALVTQTPPKATLLTGRILGCPKSRVNADAHLQCPPPSRPASVIVNEKLTKLMFKVPVLRDPAHPVALARLLPPAVSSIQRKKPCGSNSKAPRTVPSEHLSDSGRTKKPAPSSSHACASSAASSATTLDLAALPPPGSPLPRTPAPVNVLIARKKSRGKRGGSRRHHNNQDLSGGKEEGQETKDDDFGLRA